jgi:uncharacterized membrane protein YphA (DoxX/SURF4 family)
VNQKKLAIAAVELFDRLSAAWWIPALLMRLFVGYFFMETGWAKIHNLDTFAMRFAQWGIPYPCSTPRCPRTRSSSAVRLRFSEWTAFPFETSM